MPAMSKKKYRLQPVLNVRERARHEAGKRVEERRKILADAEAELARRRQSVIDCRLRQTRAHALMMRKLMQGTQAHNPVEYRTHLDDLKLLEQSLQEQVERQQAVVERAANDVEMALAALTESAKEVKVIEKHREEWTARNRLEEVRQDQKLSDEIGSILHGRRKNLL
jgi:flagellar export protein FliJ